MAINAGARGHPDFGIGGPAEISGHSTGSGMEGAFGGAAIGPDSRTGRGPAGGYTGLAANAMKNIRGRQEMAGFLQEMSKRYGFDSVRNFITGYMGMVNAPVNPNLDVSQQQNAMINNAAQNYTGPSQEAYADPSVLADAQPSYASQAQNMNVAPMGFGPSQGLGLGNYGNFGDQ